MRLLTESFPVELAGLPDVSLLVARANRTWNAADTKALATFSRALKNAPRLAVNALRIEALENSLGEIPKRRSSFRRLVKKMILLDFIGKKGV